MCVESVLTSPHLTPHAELFMVQDNSVDFHETWQFLRRRLEDIATLSMGSRKVCVCGACAMVVCDPLHQFSQVTEGGMGVASTAFTTVSDV